MNYKKPAFWIVLVSVVACVIVAVCFLTKPKAPAEQYEEIVFEGTWEELGREYGKVLTYLNRIAKLSIEEQVELGIVYPNDWLGYGKNAGTVLKTLLENAGAGKPAAAVLASLTIEGDSIYYYVHFDGKDFYIVYDNRADEYGIAATGEEYAKYLLFDEQSGELVLSNLENVTLDQLFEMTTDQEAYAEQLKELKMVYYVGEPFASEDESTEAIEEKELTPEEYWYKYKDYPVKTMDEWKATGNDFMWWRDVSNPPEELLAQFSTAQLAHLALKYPLLSYMPWFADEESALYCQTFEGYSRIWETLMQREDRTMAILDEYAVCKYAEEDYADTLYVGNESACRVMITEYYVWAYSQSFTEEERQYYLSIVEEKKADEYARIEDCSYGLSFDPDGSAYREGYNGR